LYLGLLFVLARMGLWSLVWFATALICEISFFSLIGGCLYLRRQKLGLVPSRSPERTEARVESEREKIRARMVDEVFQQVRIGKYVEATRPLARWLRDLDGETAARDARHIVGQILGWDSSGGINTLGSTLIRHLLRAGRPDAALATFERLRQHAPALTLDSADDLRSLAEYADSIGREELATSMRLETPIYRP
jgi:pentatricopeptide repeat protein